MLKRTRRKNTIGVGNPTGRHKKCCAPVWVHKTVAQGNRTDSLRHPPQNSRQQVAGAAAGAARAAGAAAGAGAAAAACNMNV